MSGAAVPLPRALLLCVGASVASARLAFSQCPDGTPPPCGGARGLASARASASSVAVLYFSARDTADTFLAEGLSEDVGTLLGGAPGVQVKPSTVVRRVQRASSGDFGRMAQQMSVRFLVDGTLRRFQSHVRLSLQVIDAQRGMTVTMGKLYDATPESLPGMAGSIAADVSAHVSGVGAGAAAAVAVRPVVGGLGSGSGGGAKKNSGPAYEHFLRGNFLLAERTPAAIVQAYAEYREAERLDPRFPAATARAAYALALANNFQVPVPGVPIESLVTRGLVAADRALRADSTLSDAWMAKGYLLFFAYPRTLRGAPEAFARAIALDPRNAEAHHQYAQVLLNLGDRAAARRELERALELEPARAISLVDLAFTVLSDTVRALQLLDSAIVLNPGMAVAYQIRGQLHAQMRHGPRALVDAEAAVRMSATGAEVAASILVRALALVGDTARARAGALRWRTPAAFGASGAEALLALGDTAAALDLLDRSPTAFRDSGLWVELQDPQFDALRANPRFQRVYSDSRPPGARSP